MAGHNKAQNQTKLQGGHRASWGSRVLCDREGTHKRSLGPSHSEVTKRAKRPKSVVSFLRLFGRFPWVAGGSSVLARCSSPSAAVRVCPLSLPPQYAHDTAQADSKRLREIRFVEIAAPPAAQRARVVALRVPPALSAGAGAPSTSQKRYEQHGSLLVRVLVLVVLLVRVLVLPV